MADRDGKLVTNRPDFLVSLQSALDKHLTSNAQSKLHRSFERIKEFKVESSKEECYVRIILLIGTPKPIKNENPAWLIKFPY